MRAFWAKHKTKILGVLLLSLPFVFFYVNSREERDLNVFDKIVLRLSSPVQEATRWVTEGVIDLWEDYLYLRDQRRENGRLAAEVRRLRELDQRSTEVDAENVRLRKMLAFHRASAPVRKIAAQVIARSTSPYFRVHRIRIDAGAKSGLERGMPVVTPDGVVGRIQRAYGPYADVQLLADPESTVDVIVQGSRATGFLKGRGEANNYRCRIEYLALPDLVREGDVVVTSGVGVGNRFPKGLVVGKVSHVLRKQFAVAQEVEVIPAVDFGKVEEVFVLLDGAGSAAGGEGGAAPAPPPEPEGEDSRATDGGPP
jgi:rod shape-determining protein MreC